APKPDERPATSIEAANLLHKAVTGKLVLPKKPPRAADARRAKLRPVVAALVATACAAVLGVCGILYFSGSGGTKPDEGNIGERAPRERPTTACYVQDGLIAMWDGIENAGRGRHDPLVKAWKNLAGGPDAVPADGLAAWSDNSALFGLGRYYLVNTLFGKPQQVTVEVCHHAVPLPMGSNFSALFSSCQDGGIGFQGRSGSHWLACLAKPEGGYYSEISLPLLRGQGETLAFTVDDAFTVYRNATVFSMVSGIKGIRYNEDHVFQMGRDPGNTGDISGEIHSIRLYSRSLSADEIRRNHEVDRVRFGLDRLAPVAAAPAAGTERKATVLFPRLDRDPKAWAYSFEEEPGWLRPDYDDSKWKRAPGGFGAREKQTDLRVGRLNTRWDTKRIFLRRHFSWRGGDVSRAVADIFHDDGVNLYLNGLPICAFTGCTVDWIPREIPVANIVRALKAGDNVLCAEVINGRGAQYFDCGMIVECGGPKEKPMDIPDGIRKVATEAGTWTVKMENGVAQIGDGRNVALDPPPKGSLTIPAELDGLKITKLAKRCFKGCKDLIGVKLPEGIRSIELLAFSNCRKLKAIVLPDTLEHIGIEAFSATALDDVDLKNVRVIERCAFKFCGALEYVSVNPVNPVYCVKDGVLYDKIAQAIVICPRSRTAFTIPRGIEAIADAAFHESKIRSIVIPDTVVYVGHAAFGDSPELEEVVCEGADARIGSLAFGRSPKLAKVVLPHHLTQLDDWSIIEGAGHLESIDLPDTVEILGDAVFKNCPMLKSIRLGKSLRIVRHRAFSRCTSLAEISFPATVKEMGDGVLSFCPSLKTVRFEGERPSMGTDFFKGSNPTTVTFAGKEEAVEDWRPGPSARWFVEWDKALAEAKRTGRKIFVLNTGSDWCGWCKKLRAEVLDKPAFEEFAARNLVLLYLDSPSRNPLGKAQTMHNREVVKALGFGGGVPNAEVFSADGRKLGRIGGGGHALDAYMDKLKKILDDKGVPVRSDAGRMLFTDGYGKLAAKIAEERAKLPPVMKEDFKATLTGVAVCDRENRKFDNLEFMPPTTHLEVAKGKMAVFRVEHDFPKGYAAAVWVTGRGGLFSNPSGRYSGKGVKYGFLGLHNAKQDVQLDSIAIRTNSEPELDDFPRGWMICSPKVDIAFLAQADNPSAEKKAEEIQTAQANGYDWRYVLDANGKAILSGNGNDPCLSPRPKGKVVVPAELNGHKVVAIGHMAFHDCPEMTAIEFPEGIEEIRGWYIFARCYGLTEVTLPKSMRRIGTWVFESCENLRRVNLMNCERADNGFGCNFIGCYALEEILCAKNNKAITSVNGVLYSKDEKTLLAYPKARDKLKLVPGVKDIANSALVSLPMNQVKIPEGIVFVN
ncbi:MAG: leucine-rich repeat protein, partial [Kiritimatiellae bacterium]|nr:leucine-rich repeat protein [Kiritimatiellia bacterium]